MLKMFKRLNQTEGLLLRVSIAFIAIQVGLELAIPDNMTDIAKALSKATIRDQFDMVLQDT